MLFKLSFALIAGHGVAAMSPGKIEKESPLALGASCGYHPYQRMGANTSHNLSIEKVPFLDGAIRVYRVPNSELVHAFLRTNLYCDGGNITCDAVWERNSIFSIF